MKFEFCPQLQLSWSFKKASFESLNQVTIILVESTRKEYPSPIGRHGSDVLSYPDIYQETNETVFHFNNCVYFNIRSEQSPGFAQHETGEGVTFQRLINSELVELHNDRAIDKVIHYRLFCVDEVIDAVCSTPPAIIIRKAI